MFISLQASQNFPPVWPNFPPVRHTSLKHFFLFFFFSPQSKSQNFSARIFLICLFFPGLITSPFREPQPHSSYFSLKKKKKNIFKSVEDFSFHLCARNFLHQMVEPYICWMNISQFTNLFKCLAKKDNKRCGRSTLFGTNSGRARIYDQWASW